MVTLHTGSADERAAARGAGARASSRAAGPHVVVGPAAALSRQALVALQRDAGNHAVAVLASRRGRSGAPPSGAAATGVAVYRDAAPAAPTTDTPQLEPYRGEAVNKPGQVSAPAKQYAIARDSGVNLRARPDGTLPEIAKLLYGAPVQVQARDTTGAFSFVVARTGTTGWINSQFLALDPPDTAARLHHITEDNLTTILKHEYVDTGRWQLGTGNDYTTLAASVIAANAGRKGAVVDWDAVERYKDDHLLKRVLDPWMIDNFAIYHGSVILSGHNIWLPSPAYVRALQASGVIGSRPGWINAAVDVGKSLAGFLAGQVAGVFGSIWDTLTGLWELATGVVETVRGALDGSLFASISDIYDAVTGLSLEDAEQLMAEVVTMGQSAFADFAHKWNHPDSYQKWYFRGYLLGAVALEIVLAIVSGGTSLAVKVLAKVGKYLPRLMRVLNRLLDVARTLPGRRDRDRDGGRRDDDESSHADRSWEQARAVAALVTEEHDRLDTPVATLIPLLNSTIAVKFQGVRGYRAIPTGQPHTYRIVQRARSDVVDETFTEAPRKTGTGWTPGPNDEDWRGLGRTTKDALDHAITRTGVPREEFSITRWGKTKEGKSFPAELRVLTGPNRGAEVNVDLGHTTAGPEVPHVGWQTAGKRSSGGGARGHILLDDVEYNR